MAKTVKQEAKEKLWKAGVLAWKCHSAQKDLYELYHKNENKVQVWLIARRFGKSHCLCLLAVEECLRKPNSIVKFVSPTKLQVNTNVRPIFRKIFEDCPDSVRPEFSQKDYIYYFPNGSEIQLAGSNSGHAEKLRGGDCSAAFVDEAGDCTDLDNIIKSILIPTTLLTKGKIIISGTPPKEPDHDFISFIEDAESKGSLIKRTIYDNPLLTREEIKEAFDEIGGGGTEAALREYMCQIIRDASTCVIPEFTPELEQQIVREWQRPAYFDFYEGMDLGFHDLTAILYAYYDFRNNKLVIEDESIIDFKKSGTTLETLVKEIQEKERYHFFNGLTNEQKTPNKRISDTEYIVLNEIKKLSQYTINFEVVKKDDLGAMVNFLREKLKKQEIIINPRCTTLIRHLRNIKWRGKDKSVFARSPDDSHYDSVAAILYLIRAIDYRKNPFPNHYGIDQKDLMGNYILKKDKKEQDRTDIYKKIFNIRQKKA